MFKIFWLFFLFKIIPIINLQSFLENEMSFKLFNDISESNQKNNQHETIVNQNKTENIRKLSENIIITKTVYTLINSQNYSFSIKLKKNSYEEIQSIKYNEEGTEKEEELDTINYHKIESNSNFDELVIKLPFATNENLVNYTFFIQFLELIDTFELVVTNFIILDPVILVHYNENEIY